jgi:hypothetical protein
MKHHTWGKINYIEGFITDSDIALVRKVLDESEWCREDGKPNSFINRLPDREGKIIQDTQHRLKSEIEKAYDCEVGFEIQGTVVKYDIGWVLPLHADVYDNLPTHAGYPTRDVSSIIYLSSDFTGGDLWFPDFDITIHPQAGAIAFFPSSLDYMHEVTELQSGNRLTCTSFWHILEPGEEAKVGS